MFKKMFIKKIIWFWMFFVSGFCQILFFSCKDSPESLTDEGFVITGEDSISDEKELKIGYLALSFVNEDFSKSNCRAALTVDEVSSLASTYELIIFNDSEYEKLTVKTEDTKIDVPVGTWNVICIAGTKKLLAGSGYAQNVVIKENEITEITMNMYSIDVLITSDKKDVYCGESYKIDVSVNTKNPYLVPGYVYANSKKVNLVCDENDCSKGSGEMEYTAGAEEETLLLTYSTSLVYFKTDSFEYKLSDCSDFEGIYNSTVIYKEGVTGVIINIAKKIVSTGVGLSICWVE